MTNSEPQEKIRVEYIDDRPVVSARELHEALGIHTIFRQWFPRMCEYGFMEGLDYTKIYQKKEGSRTGQIEVDYEISMDMAKHICMMQRTREGMECRQYFIDLERAWNSPENILQRALQIAGRKIEELQSQNRLLAAANHRKEQTIQELKPKTEYLDTILHATNLVLTTQIAKDYGMSTVRFNQLLADLGVQYRVREQWVLYAEYQDCGYTATRTLEVPQSDGTLLVKHQMEWTQKGRCFLYLHLKENGHVPVVEQQLMEATKER